MRMLWAAVLLAPAVAIGQPESMYTAAWCVDHGGEAEVALPDGTRADCVTETHAVEVERAAKWYEGIGQALWYGFQTNLQPGLVVIAGEDDERYLYRLNSVIEHYGLPIEMWTVPR